MRSEFTLAKKEVRTEGFLCKQEVYYLVYMWGNASYKPRVTKEEYLVAVLGEKITIEYSSGGSITRVTPGVIPEEGE